MQSNKPLLRAWLKTKRLAMSHEEVDKLSALIQQSLIDSINWQNLKSVHCYQAIDSLNEVKTDKIIKHLQNYPSIKLTIASQKEDEVRDEQFDLIIVPCLGFDTKGYRLGWGGGYYDKFLAKQKAALKIGLCYRAGLIKTGIPTEPHDIPLDKIITEL